MTRNVFPDASDKKPAIKHYLNMFTPNNNDISINLPFLLKEDRTFRSQWMPGANAPFVPSTEALLTPLIRARELAERKERGKNQIKQRLATLLGMSQCSNEQVHVSDNCLPYERNQSVQAQQNLQGLQLQLEAAGRFSFLQGCPKLEGLQLQLGAAERFSFLPDSPLASTTPSLPGPRHALLPDLALGSQVLQQSSHQYPRVLKSLASRRKGRIGMFPQVGTAVHCTKQLFAYLSGTEKMAHSLCSSWISEASQNARRSCRVGRRGLCLLYFSVGWLHHT
jgi:hypothetical protein